MLSVVEIIVALPNVAIPVLSASEIDAVPSKALIFVTSRLVVSTVVNPTDVPCRAT